MVLGRGGVELRPAGSVSSSASLSSTSSSSSSGVVASRGHAAVVTGRESREELVAALGGARAILLRPDPDTAGGRGYHPQRILDAIERVRAAEARLGAGGEASEGEMPRGAPLFLWLRFAHTTEVRALLRSPPDPLSDTAPPAAYEEAVAGLVSGAGAALLSDATQGIFLDCEAFTGDSEESGAPEPPQASGLATTFSLLQSCRLRSTATEFISCPSCGRTLFDIQKTTERIRVATGHLPGVRVAVMGCVVNGPGEMADAHFGYVGSGPGIVDLYVGKECVRRAVKQEVAVAGLIDLIKKKGMWREPGEER